MHLSIFRGLRCSSCPKCCKPECHLRHYTLSSDSLRVPTLSAFALIAAALAWSWHTSLRQHGFDLPNVVLWAWERPEDLRFIDPQRTGVAFLAATVSISSNGSVCFRPRMQG